MVCCSLWCTNSVFASFCAYACDTQYGNPCCTASGSIFRIASHASFLFTVCKCSPHPSNFPPNAGATLNATVGCFVREVVRTCGAAPCAEKCSVFLTTDSAEAQHAFTAGIAAHGIPVVTSAGDMSHLEHSPGNASAHRKTFADWYTLTRLGRLVSSRSGFSETAAWCGNVPAKSLVRADACLFSNGVEVPDGAEF